MKHPSAKDPRPADLVEAKIDDWVAQIELRCAQGAERATEEVLDKLAAHPPNEEVVLELVYAEVLARENSPRPAQLDELLKRFPQLAQRLEKLWAVHVALERESGQMADSTPLGLQDTLTDGSTSSLDAVPTQQAGGARLGSYELLETIGQGGAGIVYKAFDHKLGRTVAVKVIRNRLATMDAAERLLKEARAVAQLHHPNIVQVFETRGDLEPAFLVLEYVEGGGLDTRLAQSTLPAVAACRLLQTVAVAIAYAHEHGIVHRDLKPGNILIDLSGEPKITDFGLAKMLDSSLARLNSPPTQTGVVLGTLGYMAPEQLSGDPRQIGPATDIYALGAVLYQALVGRAPLIGESPLDTAEMIRSQMPTPPRHIDSRIRATWRRSACAAWKNHPCNGSHRPRPWPKNSSDFWTGGRFGHAELRFGYAPRGGVAADPSSPPCPLRWRCCCWPSHWVVTYLPGMNSG